jgi:hypothetical protein
MAIFEFLAVSIICPPLRLCERTPDNVPLDIGTLAFQMGILKLGLNRAGLFRLGKI